VRRFRYFIRARILGAIPSDSPALYAVKFPENGVLSNLLPL
jgi:hypothetical protein